MSDAGMYISDNAPREAFFYIYRSNDRFSSCDSNSGGGGRHSGILSCVRLSYNQFYLLF